MDTEDTLNLGDRSSNFGVQVLKKNHEGLPENVRRYLCADCGKTFKSSKVLRQHVKIHTGDKTYHCKLCGKSFRRSAHLAIHSTIHTRDKPYHCKVCKKSFRQEPHLVAHERLHTGYSHTSVTCVTKASHTEHVWRCIKEFTQETSPTSVISVRRHFAKGQLFYTTVWRTTKRIPTIVMYVRKYSSRSVTSLAILNVTIQHLNDK